MAQKTPRRYALEEIKAALELISIERGYSTDVATVRTHIFGREDIRMLGALPAVGFMSQRDRVDEYQAFGRARIALPIVVSIVVEAPSWEAGVIALDDLQDDVIAALSTEPTLTNDLASILYTGCEDDTGSPDTADSRGGTMAMLLYFDVYHYRSNTRAKT